MRRITSCHPYLRSLVRIATILGMLGSLLACTQHDAETPQQMTGIWRIENPIFAVRTAEGKEPPLRPEAAKIYSEHMAARKNGDTSFDSATWCSSVGNPRLMFIDVPFQLLVRPQHVAVLHEWNWWARIIYMETAATSADAASEDLNIPGPMGRSLGKWDGDTLVVETTQLLDSTLIDSAGMPHSSELKITERLRLRSADVLEARIRIEDPMTFTEPWETLVTYRRQHNAIIREDVCLDRIKTGAPALKE